MNKNICYITYQTFPAATANSLQTIKNIDSFVKNQCNVDLFFPDRSKESSDDIETIQNTYNISSKFNIKKLPHKYPFGKYKRFKKLIFHYSHFMWAKTATKNIINKNENYDFFITRSDWVYYFLLKNSKKVIFECHQSSKLRKLIIRKNHKKKNSFIIFLNQNLLESFFKNTNYSRTKVLHNAVDLDEFKVTDKKNQVIFIGNFNRFDEDRGLQSILKGFSLSVLAKDYCLKIIGGSSFEVNDLKNFVNKNSLSSNIEIIQRQNRRDAIKEINSSMVGILTNTSNNSHSKLYTSPLKYFEYIAAGLSVIATDFPSHRSLPLNEDIIYFKENDLEDIVFAFNNIGDIVKNNNVDLYSISLDFRTKSILQIYK
jgi:hypothetical protein